MRTTVLLDNIDDNSARGGASPTTSPLKACAVQGRARPVSAHGCNPLRLAQCEHNDGKWWAVLRCAVVRQGQLTNRYLGRQTATLEAGERNQRGKPHKTPPAGSSIRSSGSSTTTRELSIQPGHLPRPCCDCCSVVQDGLWSPRIHYELIHTDHFYRESRMHVPGDRRLPRLAHSRAALWRIWSSGN